MYVAKVTPYTAHSSSLTTKRHLLHQVIHSGKELWKHSINETGESQGSQNCTTVSHALSSLQWSYAMLMNAEHPLWNTNMQLQWVQTYNIATGTVYWQCLACTGYVFCGTLILNVVLWHTKGVSTLFYGYYSAPHEESRQIANMHDVTTNHRNTLDHAKWPSKTSSLARMNGTCCDRARKLWKVSVHVKNNV